MTCAFRLSPPIFFAHTFERGVVEEVCVVSELRSLLDHVATLDLSALDPDELVDGELLGGMPVLQAGINQLGALLTRFVAAADRREAQRADGMVSMKTWLTGHLRLSGREAAALVRDGRRLSELPALGAAYASGGVTAAHVGVVTAAVTPRVPPSPRPMASIWPPRTEC